MCVYLCVGAVCIEQLCYQHQTAFMWVVKTQRQSQLSVSHPARDFRVWHVCFTVPANKHKCFLYFEYAWLTCETSVYSNLCVMLLKKKEKKKIQQTPLVSKSLRHIVILLFMFPGGLMEGIIHILHASAHWILEKEKGNPFLKTFLCRQFVCLEFASLTSI